MSEDQKEDVIRQKKEAERKLNLLLAEAEELASTFPGELGASLRASPEYVVFDCQIPTVNTKYYTRNGNNRVYKSNEGSERVVALTNEIRSAVLLVAKLSEQASI
jgi:hypothetical protein